MSSVATPVSTTSFSKGKEEEMDVEMRLDKGRFLERAMRVGDLVMLCSGSKLAPLRLQSGEVFTNKWGHFSHDDMIGKPWGLKIHSRTTDGYMYALLPTPELYAAGGVSHRTQVVHTPDIAAILFNLDVTNGSVVVESGTGSACFSRAIARAIGTTGHLFTFEFHEGRARSAKEDFVNECIAEHITINHRDVCERGFSPLVRGQENISQEGAQPGAQASERADAAILDLPQPALAIEHLLQVLRPGARVACYSPCIEQVQATYAELERCHFTQMRTIELVNREYKHSERPVAEWSVYPPEEVYLTSSRREYAQQLLSQAATQGDTDAAEQLARVQRQLGRDTESDGSGSADESAKSGTCGSPTGKRRLRFADQAVVSKAPRKLTDTNLVLRNRSAVGQVHQIAVRQRFITVGQQHTHTSFLTFATLSPFFQELPRGGQAPSSAEVSSPTTGDNSVAASSVSVSPQQQDLLDMDEDVDVDEDEDVDVDVDVET